MRESQDLIAEWRRLDKALLAEHARGLIGLSSCLKGEVAPITDDLRQAEPAIDFFAQRNPGWADGHELPCVARADLWTFTKAIVPFLWKALRSNRRPTLSQPASAPERG